jgi:hypothetical protein
LILLIKHGVSHCQLVHNVQSSSFFLPRWLEKRLEKQRVMRPFATNHKIKRHSQRDGEVRSTKSAVPSSQPAAHGGCFLALGAGLTAWVSTGRLSTTVLRMPKDLVADVLHCQWMYHREIFSLLRPTRPGGCCQKSFHSDNLRITYMQRIVSQAKVDTL